MRSHPLRQTFVLVAACLLAILLFPLVINSPGMHFSGRYLFALVVVFLWGRRRDIYLVAALASVLIAAGYWFANTRSLADLVAYYVLPIAFLWVAAWLLARHKRQQEEMETQVQARTAELQASERRYRLLAESTTDVVWTVDLQGKLTYVSPAIEPLIGGNRDEMMQLAQGAGLPPLLTAPVEEALAAAQAAVAAGRPFNGMRFVIPQLHKDGRTLRWTELFFDLLRDDAGALIGLRASTRDITERKRMEDLAQQQHERLVAMIESSPDRIWSVDREYHLLVGNSAFARGVTLQIGRPLAPGECVLDEPFPPQARDLWQPLYDRAFAGERFTIQIQSHISHGVMLECQLHPIYAAEGGTIDGAAARAVDITARIEAEARVHETLARLQLATAAAGMGVWNWNFADGSLEWDEQTCELYAVPPDLRRAGLYYDVWQARVHPEDAAYADPARGDPQRVPARWSGTYRIVLPGGAIRHVQSAAVTQYDRDGQPLRMIGVVRDVTDQKQYELLLRDTNAELEQRVVQRTADLQAALAEVQAANRLKDEFMAMISHELRTPLTGVLSMSELLGEQIAGPLNARQAVYVRGINESGERLLYVINNILGYTHLLSGKLQLRHEPCELGYLLHVCAVSQRAKAEAKQQVIEEVVDPANLSVKSDAEALGEVLKRL
ncbi:MAG: PAS domain S-box protein, partial [Caldilineaceae bacterium]